MKDTKWDQILGSVALFLIAAAPMFFLISGATDYGRNIRAAGVAWNLTGVLLFLGFVAYAGYLIKQKVDVALGHILVLAVLAILEAMAVTGFHYTVYS